MKFSIIDFFSNWDQICRKLRIWSHLQKKPLMENFIFCAIVTKQTMDKKNLKALMVLSSRFLKNHKLKWLQESQICVSYWAFWVSILGNSTFLLSLRNLEQKLLTKLADTKPILRSSLKENLLFWLYCIFWQLIRT